MTSWVRASAVQMWGPSSNPQHYTKSRVWPLLAFTAALWRGADKLFTMGLVHCQPHSRFGDRPCLKRIYQRVINILAHIETHTKKWELAHLNMGCWGAHGRKENGVFHIPVPPPNSSHLLARTLAVGSVWNEFLSAGSHLEPRCLGVWTPETKLYGNSRPAQERAGVRGKILIWDLCGNRSEVVGRLSAVVVFRPHVRKWQGLLLLG